MLPVIRTNPTPVLVGLGPMNRLDSFFDRVFGDDGGAMGQAWSWAPVAMWQDDDHFFIEAEMPGLSDDEIELTVHNEVLAIRSERKPEEGAKYLYNNRSYGRFERTITLPEPVNSNDVRATLTTASSISLCPKVRKPSPRGSPFRRVDRAPSRSPRPRWRRHWHCSWPSARRRQAEPSLGVGEWASRRCLSRLDRALSVR